MRDALAISIALNPHPFPRKYTPLAYGGDQNTKAVTTQSILLQQQSHLSWEKISNVSSAGVLFARAHKCLGEHNLESVLQCLKTHSCLLAWHNLIYASQRSSLILPVTTYCQSSPMVAPGLALFTSPAAVVLPQKRIQLLQSGVSVLAGLSRQGVGAFTWKGRESVSFPKISSARWG